MDLTNLTSAELVELRAAMEAEIAARQAAVTTVDLTALTVLQLTRLQTDLESECERRLEAPQAPNPREGYFTQGPGREVAQRDAEAVAEDREATMQRLLDMPEPSSPVQVSGYVDTTQPAEVKLYQVDEVLEYMSATLLVIDGAMYRVGCMGGDVEQRRPLMLLPVSMARAPHWADQGRVFGPATAVTLEVGGRIKISGTGYGVSRYTGGLRLVAVR